MKDAVGRFFRNGYPLIFAFVFLVYPGVAALAPVFASKGHLSAARVIYRVFGLFCHQLPYRSFFLFGKAACYPLESAGIQNALSFEEAIGSSGQSLRDLKQFIGNETIGWKMAVCQRDVAIALSMFLFCVLFFFLKDHINKLPLSFWLLLAILPMGLDGGTQVISRVIQWFPLRESTPFLRCLTGFLFGFFTCAFILPRLEAELKETDRLEYEPCSAKNSTD